MYTRMVLIEHAFPNEYAPCIFVEYLLKIWTVVSTCECIITWCYHCSGWQNEIAALNNIHMEWVTNVNVLDKS